jgi:hypothetical protein
VRNAPADAHRLAASARRQIGIALAYRAHHSNDGGGRRPRHGVGKRQRLDGEATLDCDSEDFVDLRDPGDGGTSPSTLQPNTAGSTGMPCASNSPSARSLYSRRPRPLVAGSGRSTIEPDF